VDLIRMLSIWLVMLLSCIPPLALVVCLLYCPVRPRQTVLSLTRCFLFTNLAGALPAQLIKLVLFFFIVTFSGLSIDSYRTSASQTQLDRSAPLDSQLMFQSKAWRGQRNLYLSGLGLLLWWMLFSIYHLTLSLHLAQQKLNSFDLDSPVDTRSYAGCHSCHTQPASLVQSGNPTNSEQSQLAKETLLENSDKKKSQ